MPRPPQFFTTLAGVPVRYDREPLSQYGSRGVPFRFHSEPDFTAKLETCMTSCGACAATAPPR